ncbi:MAG: hypothetical protein ACTSV1_06830, partial [Alphaproteobacteria bacterium]
SEPSIFFVDIKGLTLALSRVSVYKDQHEKYLKIRPARGVRADFWRRGFPRHLGYSGTDGQNRKSIAR